MINLIYAKDKNNGIGKDNKLPWSFEKDMIHFWKTIYNKNVILGKHTWESMPKKRLDNTTNSVLVVDRSNFENVMITLENPNHEVFILGGATIYNEVYLRKNIHANISSVYETIINDQYNCDSFLKFNLKNNKNFKLIQNKKDMVDNITYKVWYKKPFYMKLA